MLFTFLSFVQDTCTLTQGIAACSAWGENVLNRCIQRRVDNRSRRAVQQTCCSMSSAACASRIDQAGGGRLANSSVPLLQFNSRALPVGMSVPLYTSLEDVAEAMAT